MGANEIDTESGSAEGEGALPEFAPSRQVGWIFRDGDSVAIERQGPGLRGRVWAD